MKQKYTEAPKIRELDEIDRRILNMLSDNARTKLTVIARNIQLSVDSTKKRIQKLEKDGVITKYTIQPDAVTFGLNLGVHIYLKLKDIDKELYDKMLDDFMKNPRIIDLITVLGDYDIYLVYLAKNSREMEEIKLEIRQKYGSIIGEWNEVIVSKIYKLEDYKF